MRRLWKGEFRLKQYSITLTIRGQRTGINYDALTRRLIPGSVGYKPYIETAIVALWRRIYPEVLPLTTGEMVATLADDFDCSYASVIEKAVSFLAGRVSRP